MLRCDLGPVKDGGRSVATARHLRQPDQVVAAPQLNARWRAVLTDQPLGAASLVVARRVGYAASIVGRRETGPDRVGVAAHQLEALATAVGLDAGGAQLGAHIATLHGRPAGGLGAAAATATGAATGAAAGAGPGPPPAPAPPPRPPPPPSPPSPLVLVEEVVVLLLPSVDSSPQLTPSATAKLPAATSVTIRSMGKVLSVDECRRQHSG